MKKMANEDVMREVLKLSCDNVLDNGGPFAAVIVKDNKIVGTGVNKVTKWLDPTAHAEVNAIRAACTELMTYDLTDCVIYTSCEPCPMCLGAIYWARLKAIYYGNTRIDAAKIGFDDQFIYQEIETAINDRTITAKQLLPNEAKEAFRLWEDKVDKIRY